MKENKEIQMAFRITEEERRKLKMLAAHEGKTLKNLFFDALEKMFPN